MKETIELSGQVYDSGDLLRDRYGLSEMTIYRWTKRGLLPPPIRRLDSGARIIMSAMRLKLGLAVANEKPPSRLRPGSNQITILAIFMIETPTIYGGNNG